MKKFRINVNGNSYEVEVEEMGSVASPAPVSAPPVTFVPVAAPAPVATPAPTKAPAAPASAPAPTSQGTAGNIKISAPMPGTILNIKVQVGDKVNSGDVVCILEAMKMENEIMAPEAGTVSSINVATGASVNSGDLLVTLS